MAEIHFSDLPGFPNLFLDYVYEYENCAGFFARDFKKKSDYRQLFYQVSARQRPFSDILVKALAKSYAGTPVCEKTKKNILALRSQNTIAIVTGQQLGLLGGPLYTIYKTITAIKLAESLNESYPEFAFIPVFWLEADDHDYDEVRHVFLPDSNNKAKQITYDPENAFDGEYGSVGELQFSDAIKVFMEEYKQTLRTTEFTDEIFHLLQSCYKPGATFKSAFKDLLFNLFDAKGLVLFDPQMPEVKQILTPVFLQEITGYRLHAEALIKRSAELEAKYHAQVKIRSVNLFYHADKGRHAVEPDEDGGFKLKRKRQKFSEEQLIALIKSSPGQFSPNVLLRPICQDYLLPTGMYIAGPSEISYFAQVSPLYDFFRIPMPNIYPRASVTLMEKNLAATVLKLNIKLPEIFLGEDILLQKTLNRTQSFDVDAQFAESQAELEKILGSLQQQILEIDKTIADAADRYKIKIVSSLAEYKTKVLEAQKRKNETTVRQLQKITDSVFPNQSLQERLFGYFYFANKYGDQLIHKLFNEIKTDVFSHQVIEL
ncbi:MAG: bacillithiol biosynthesis cysteine-adding enzyme BshC [Ignavibacteriales bacterium]|nr:bacillithiol biosynthesis cysteine-adding enzyme BshC [Ignavibacteriales bacterium]